MSTLELFLARHLAFKCLRVLVARNLLCVLTPGYDLLNLLRTLLWAFLMTHEWTPVSLVAQNLLALLVTHVLLMLGVIRVADSCTDMATIQTELARPSATPLRGLFEVLSTGCFYLSLWVIHTAQGQSLSSLVMFPQSVEDVTPQFHLAKYCTVANTVEAFLGTRQGDADAIGNAQKANFTLLVAADQRQQDNVVLFSLILVNNMHSDPLKLAGGHEFAQTVELPSVGGKDGNLLWFVVLKEKIATKCNYKLSFMSVLMAFPVFDLLLQMGMLHKEQVGINTL